MAKLTVKQKNAIESLIKANKRIENEGLYIQDVASSIVICKHTKDGFEVITTLI
jgi:hypothetical protein